MTGADRRRRDVTDALQQWREAQKRLDETTDGDRTAIEGEVDRARHRYQRASGKDMVTLLDEIHEAEMRRQAAEPSSREFHRAAQDEMALATQVWDAARMSDEEVP